MNIIAKNKQFVNALICSTPVLLLFLRNIKIGRVPDRFFAVTRPPWGTLVCFNPLFVFVSSLHTVHVLQWNPVKRTSLSLFKQI